MTDNGTTSSLEGDALETWSAFATVLEWLPAALDAQLLRDSDITHFEYGILFALAQAPERTLRLSVLAGYANSTLSRLSRAATRLEKRGWLRRQPDPADGRFTLAILSDAGQERFDSATPGHAAIVQQLVLNSLTRSQAVQLREISGRISRSINEGGAWKPDAPAR